MGRMSLKDPVMDAMRATSVASGVYAVGGAPERKDPWHRVDTRGKGVGGMSLPADPRSPILQGGLARWATIFSPFVSGAVRSLVRIHEARCGRFELPEPVFTTPPSGVLRRAGGYSRVACRSPLLLRFDLRPSIDTFGQRRVSSVCGKEPGHVLLCGAVKTRPPTGV